MTISSEHAHGPVFLPLHLIVATALSLLVPGLGGSYLGMPSGETDWQKRARVLPGLLVLAYILMDDGLNLFTLTLLVGGWAAVVGWGSIRREWVWALAHPAEVRIAPNSHQFGTGLMMCIWLALMAMSSMAHWPTFFRAPYGTLLADSGDLLYGFEYDGGQIRATRGLLILTRIDGQPALARIIAVPGDMVGIGAYAIQVNGSVVHLKKADGLNKDSARLLMADIANELAYPSQEHATTRPATSAVPVRGKEPLILGEDDYLVAFDNDLMAPYQEITRTILINGADIVAVPWAKIGWSGSAPGNGSDLAQPIVVTDR